MHGSNSFGGLAGVVRQEKQVVDQANPRFVVGSVQVANTEPVGVDAAHTPDTSASNNASTIIALALHHE